MNQNYTTFLERMRAENPDGWPEDQDYPDSPQGRTISDDEACEDIRVDEQHILTMMMLCNGRQARLDLTDQAIHVTGRLSKDTIVRNAVPLQAVQKATFQLTRYGADLQLEFRHPGAQMLYENHNGLMQFHDVEDLSQLLDFLQELKPLISAREMPTGA